MTDENKPATASKTPTHYGYTVRGEGKTATWIKIGAVWPHADGNGSTLQLDANPIDGRVIIRIISEKEAA